MAQIQRSSMIGWEKLYEAQLQAVEQLPGGKQSLLYGEAAMRRSSNESSSRSSTSTKVEKASKASQSSGKMASLKSFLRGDVHRHHGMYVLEESVTGKPSAARESYETASKPSSVHSSSTASSLRKFF